MCLFQISFGAFDLLHQGLDEFCVIHFSHDLRDVVVIGSSGDGDDGADGPVAMGSEFESAKSRTSSNLA